MNQFLNWFAMGGYSQYVWSAYSFVFVFFLMNYLGIKWKKKQTRHLLKQWFKK
jgi:heme exporter protein D